MFGNMTVNYKGYEIDYHINKIEITSWGKVSVFVTEHTPTGGRSSLEINLENDSTNEALEIIKQSLEDRIKEKIDSEIRFKEERKARQAIEAAMAKREKAEQE